MIFLPFLRFSKNNNNNDLLEDAGEWLYGNKEKKYCSI